MLHIGKNHGEDCDRETETCSRVITRDDRWLVDCLEDSEWPVCKL